MLNEKSPPYLFDLVHNLNRVHETRHSNNIPAIHVLVYQFMNQLLKELILPFCNI